MIYTMLDTGNFFVIPGSPAEVWIAEEYKVTHSRESLRAQHGLRPDDSVIAVVGSPFLYNGLWREHALVMRALARAILMIGDTLSKDGRCVQLLIVGHGNQSSNYGATLQVTDQQMMSVFSAQLHPTHVPYQKLRNLLAIWFTHLHPSSRLKIHIHIYESQHIY